ncbi:MAG TPA: O-antigen ligase family protein [Solirubrobacteraceae bacterium]|nr:O-antigen ligase family protein [Solirubrobacteraceae bacterium]
MRPHTIGDSRGLLAFVGASALALLTLGAAHKLGLIALVIAPAGALLVFVVMRPLLAVALPAVFAVVIEQSTPNALGVQSAQLHDPLPGHFTPLELMLVLAIVSVSIDAVTHRRIPLGPRPFGPALSLVALGCVVGVIVGHAGGGSFTTISEQLRLIAPLIVMPWLVVNVVPDTTGLRRAIGVLGGLIAVKAGLGLVGFATGQGEQLGGTFGSGVITYYEATMNWLSMTYLLAMLGATLAGVETSRWARWATPLVFLSLLLSYRRSFWLAVLAAAPVVLAVCARRTTRHLMIPALAAIGVVLWLTISAGVVTEVQGPLATRVQSLSPSKLSANAEDRYRIDERRNVLADVREHPFTGLGLAVPWTQRYPLGIQHPGGQLYVHMAVLWWWSKLGMLGLCAYIALMGTIMWQGFRLWFSREDPLIRLGAMAAATGVLGLMTAETTASFTGVDPRLTPVLGAVAGLLAAAGRVAARSKRARLQAEHGAFPSSTAEFASDRAGARSFLGNPGQSAERSI